MVTFPSDLSRLLSGREGMVWSREQKREMGFDLQNPIHCLNAIHACRTAARARKGEIMSTDAERLRAAGWESRTKEAPK